MSKPIEFMGDSKERLSSFPVEVKKVIGFALRQAQNGEKHIDAKPLPGIGAIEVVVDFNGNTYTEVSTQQN